MADYARRTGNKVLIEKELDLTFRIVSGYLRLKVSNLFPISPAETGSASNRIVEETKVGFGVKKVRAKPGKNRF